MVCDHCHAHGLTCNEDAVCDNCRLYEVPCVHRRCRLSPDRKADCQDNDCRYVHRDSADAIISALKGIIVSGKLQKYLSKGQMPDRSFDDLNLFEDWDAWHVELNRRQEAAFDDYTTAVNQGEPVDSRYLDCSCEPETSEQNGIRPGHLQVRTA